MELVQFLKQKWSNVVDRQQKEAFVSSMREQLSEASIVVVARQAGMTVSEVTDLRRKMREANASFKVGKNTLVRLAVNDLPFKVVEDQLSGPTTLAFSEDPVAAAKVMFEFAKGNDKLEIICGALGDRLLDKSGVEALAKLPSLDALRGKIIGVIQAPAQKMACVTQAPAGQLARVFSAYGAKE